MIGVGCRFADGIDSPAALWEALLGQRNVVGEIPAERWDVEGFYDAQPGTPGCSVSRWGGFLDDVFGFDAGFFNIAVAEATHMDPQHRILLEVGVEALEHAGIAVARLAGTRGGVFLGVSYADYQCQLAHAGELAHPYAFTGTSPAVASGRIAYHLGLHGPAVTVDTACSSSLAAVHLAMQSLRLRETDVALAGGVSLHLRPDIDASASALGMLSPRGRCAAFDIQADGFVRAEGCAVVVLKRLTDAVRDRDRVLAVLRGSAVNQDGRSQGLTAPDSGAQEWVQRAALADGGVDPDTVGLVEAHGTGTAVGDPVEWTALGRVYGRGRCGCAVGSVKTNLGHTETVSGVAGLIKVVEAMRHAKIPANLHFTEFNPALGAESTGLFVPTETVDWPDIAGPRRAAVSSYGFSGTNAHVVVEAPALVTVAENGQRESASRDSLFVLSATDAEALSATASRVADWLASGGAQVDLPDIAHTLACRRTHRPSRLAIAATSRDDLITGLRCAVSGEPRAGVVRGQALGAPRGPVFVFSGHGGQWPAMGRSLLAHDPAFLAAVTRLDALIADEAGFSVMAEMSCEQPSSAVDRVQPTVFAVQVGLAASWRARGVHPAAVVGHSMGEVAAAVVGGRLSAADGVKVICRRAGLMARVAGGAMAAIELPVDRIASDLAAAGADEVAIGVYSSPKSSVISGDADQVGMLVDRWERQGISARLVQVELASHSPQVDPILDDIYESLGDLSPAPRGDIAFYSTVLDCPTVESAFDAHYWVLNLREPVRFSAAVRAALDDGHRVFVEVSPHPLALKAVADCAEAAGIAVAAIPTLRREQIEADPIVEQVAAVHCAGARVDFGSLYGDGALVDVPLPVWSHQRFVISPGTGPANHTEPQDILVGEGIVLPGTPGDRAWQCDVGTAVRPWVQDHRVHDAAVLPGAAFADMALAAAEQLFGAGLAEVQDLTLDEVLFVSDHTAVTAVAERTAPDQYRWQATSRDDEGHQVRHATAILHGFNEVQRRPAYELDEFDGCDMQPVDLDKMRRSIHARGVDHGPSFRALTALYRVSGEPRGAVLVGELRLPNSVRASRSRVHPALLDACFQALLGSVDADDDALLLPVRMSRIRSCGIAAKPTRCAVRLEQPDGYDGALEGDIDVLDAQGRVVLSVEGLVLDGSAIPGDQVRDLTLTQRLLAVDWEPKDPVDSDTNSVPLGAWLVVTEGTQHTQDLFTHRLVDDLTQWGAVTSMSSVPLGDDTVEWTDLVSGLGVQPRSGLIVVCPQPSREDPDTELDRERLRVLRLIKIIAVLGQSSAAFPPRVYVVTRGAQRVGVPGDSRDGFAPQSGLRGLCRVAGAEHPELRIVHVDIDEQTDASSLAYEIAEGDAYDETAWRNNHRYVAMLKPAPLQPDDRLHRTVLFGQDNYRVTVRDPGDLDTVEYQEVPRTPPGRGQVEVQTLAVSVNFADVLAAMGTVQTYDGGLPPLGVELAGKITAVGEGVTGWVPGDRVVALARPGVGAWRAFDTLAEHDVHRIPDALTVADAAGLLGTYVTAWYGLHTLAQLQPGERVLIHSATGGVGMAAIAIARLLGAEVFATAGTADKRALLQRLGVGHVYDSRSVEFADQIRVDTNGDGVDVVLNSLAGYAQRASIDLVSIGGRFVEIGKKDIYADSKIGLLPFRRNIAFYSVDLLLLRSRKNALCNRLIGEVLDLVAQHRLPVLRHTDYPLEQTPDVLRTMGAAQHTGKLVLTLPSRGSGSAFVNPDDVALARGDGAYILTGGLGGLGLLVARHLADAGAGRIIINSRSQPRGHAADVIAELRAEGTDIVVVCGDISQPATAHQLVNTATRTGLSVRGIVHAAAVVDDAAIANIDRPRLDRNWNPKVLGAWNLHTASHNEPLDWFCCFSSAAALLGSAGQGAYAAANSWMDGFVAWRRIHGLPATAIAWGAWAQVGRGAFLGEDGRTAMIAPEEGVYAFDQILRHDRSYTGYLPTNDAPWVQSLAERSPFAAAFAPTSESSTAPAEVLHEFRQTPVDDRGPFLRKYLCAQIATIIRAATVDPGRRFSECGLDSLGKLELRTRIDKDLGVRVSTKILWEHDTAHTLALHLLDRATPPDTTALAAIGAQL